MARQAQGNEVEAILRETVDAIVGRTAAAIGRVVAARVAAELKGGARAKAAPRRRRAAQAEITRWVADRRARRVPNFVIEATGLDTKKKIVAKFGPNVVFEKGKGLPSPAAKPSPKAQAKKAAASK